MISRRVKNCRGSVRQQLLDKAQSIEDDKLINFARDGFDLPQKTSSLSDFGVTDLNDSSAGSFETDDLRALLSEELRTEQGLDYNVEQILIGQSADSNFSLLLQTILNPTEEIIVTKPYREHYPDLIKLAGGQPIFLDTGNDKHFKIDINDLESLITPKTRAIVINASMGLLGGNYTINELIELADFVVRHKMLVIWDEMDNEYCFDSKQALNIASINQKIKHLSVLLFGNAIPIHADSHCYIAANKTIIGEMKKIGVYFNPPIFFDGTDHRINKKSTLKLTKSILQSRRNLMIDCLMQDQELDILVPSGGYYIYVDITRILSNKKNGNHSDNSIGFCEALLMLENVLLMPGEIIGMRRLIRLSFLGSEAEIRSGCQRLLSFIKKY
ncbi:aminotransferase class I/II-fold pyridoxal phosphate-dependent enzyme [Eubacteriaceae bacterium ES2]|nr:aminotransferase class I/II-fold pyridoxal phosphate-dependent enzyme [Eubacteriaceae bacterium ES2]